MLLKAQPSWTNTSRYLDIVVFERDVRRERFHGDSSGSNGIHSNDTGTARRESLHTTSLDRRALNTHITMAKIKICTHHPSPSATWDRVYAYTAFNRGRRVILLDYVSRPGNTYIPGLSSNSHIPPWIGHQDSGNKCDAICFSYLGVTVL